MSINNLIKFLLIFLLIDYVNVLRYYNEDYVYLTDMKTTHHQLPYNVYDQCKLQPGQFEHNAYGFVFKLPENLMCDELLICHPSQLSGNNTLNGTIRLIQYRLKDHRNKTVTKLCEAKRKEFCDGEGKQTGNCKLGKPGSVLWHGIKLTSAYEGNVLITNISLSITNKVYHLINVSYFDIELVSKNSIATQVHEINIIKYKYIEDKHVQGKRIEFPKDDQIFKEYFSKISKQVYLHRYAGLWTLGLNMLPSAAQQELNLFVYRGCACGMEAWFKRPTTSKTLIPKVIEGEKEKFIGKLYKDKDCPKRQISNKKFFLGELGNDEEIFVNFTIWSGSEGKYGKIELKNEIGKIFELYANEKVIKHIFKGEVKREIEQPFNMLAIGATLVLTFRLTQYYIWLGYSSDMFGNEFVVSKFFTEKWWEGNLFGNSNIELIGDGDFNIVTPVVGKKLNEREIEKLSNIFNHKPKSFNYKFNMDTIKSDELTLIFYCKPDTFSNTFYITLNAQKIKAFSLEFDFDTLKLSTSSATQGKKSTYYDSYNITTIQKGKPFEFKLIVNKAAASMFNYEVYINREEFKNNKIMMNSPTWLIDEIEISKSLEVMDIQINEVVHEMPQLKHKIKLERKIKGTILCFDAKIPKAEVMKGEKSFQVYLLNEVNDFNDRFGDTVMMVNFIFDPINYIFNDTHYTFTGGSDSFIIIKSFTNGNWTEEKRFYNPISQTDTEIIVHIVADDNGFRISLNKATDYILYEYILESFAVNHAMVTGYIENIHFFSDKCDEEESFFPSNLYIVKQFLQNYDTIIIDGNIKTPFEPIIVSFLKRGFTPHSKVGETVFQLNITNNCTRMMYSTNAGVWNESNARSKCNSKSKDYLNLEEGQRIIINIELGFLISSSIETENNKITLPDYQTQLSLARIHHIHVTGLDFSNKQRISVKYIPRK